MERLRPGDPEQIGPWQIVNRLGAGGMGVVYMGTNGTRAAAIKVVRDFLLEDPSSRARLGREVASLYKVKSKFIAEIVGADVDGNPAWLATNYVDGPSIQTLVENEGPLNEAKWFELAFGVLSALKSVHEVGIIHRDVKPANILVTANGPKLIDFGISFSKDATALTRTGVVAGTPTWFAPEQFQANKITNAIDIFAAGSTLSFAATGKSPWAESDSSVANTMNAILTREPDLSELTERQAKIINALLDKDPKKRVSASEILKEIEEYLVGLSGDFRESPKGSKKRLAVAISLVASLSIAAGAFWNMRIAPQSGAPNKVVLPTPSTSPSFSWRIFIDGENKPQRGDGRSYEFFLCDQGVIQESLRITELTLPVSEDAPKAKVIKGDERCGEEFDTIVVTGLLDLSKQNREYVLAGSTQAGFILQYSFKVSGESE